MGIANKVSSAGQRRGWWQTGLKALGWAAAGWTVLKLPAALPPGFGLLIIAAAACVGIVVLTRYDREEVAGPALAKIQLVTLTVVGAAGYVVYTAIGALGRGVDPVSRALIVLVAVVAVAVTAWTAWSRLKDTSPTALPVTVGDAVDVVTDGSRLNAVGLLVAFVTVAGALALAGITYAPAVVLALLIPVAIGWKDARERGATRAEFSGAFVATLAGGAWTKPLENSNRSPISCRWDDDQTQPSRIVMPIPPAWKATGEEALETEVANRLAVYGEYIIRIELGAARRLTATRVMPLPEILAYDGRGAVDGASVWLGVGKATRQHMKSKGAKGKANGELFDVMWNLRTEPHGLAVGTTGAGKSQTVSLIMMQLVKIGWKLLLLDPKKVEFTAWEGRPGVLKVATELSDMADTLVSAREEMMRRYDLLRAAQVNHIDLLPPGDDHPPRLLIVVDEVVELLDKSKTKTDESKETNELRDQCSESIGSILQLGRAAGVHMLVCGQRVTRDLFSGSFQNNIACKLLHGCPDFEERKMIGINDVLATQGIPGRGVMRSLALPQTETQMAYLDLEGGDLDRFLPRGGADPVAPVVHVAPEDLVPLRLTTTPPPVPVHVPVPAKKPAGNTGNGAGNDDDDSGPKFKFGRQEPMSKGEAMVALEAMIGLGGVKGQVRQLQATVQAAAARRNRHLGGKEDPAPNLLFVGPPGTGKTVTARIFASMLHDLGALPSGHLIEADRASLIGAYVGHTALKVTAAFDAAEGGVLFIDEAYSLVDGGSGGFGAEAVASLVKLSEDRRGRVVVIMAGYNADMDRLLDANLGLRSRFSDDGRIRFEAYDTDELAEIYAVMVAGADRLLVDDALDAIATVVAAADRDGKDWGNGRSIRVMVAAACNRADVRLEAVGFEAASDLDLITLTAEDILGPVTVPDDVQDDVVDAEVLDEVIEGEIVDDATDNAVDDADVFDAGWADDFVKELIAEDADAGLPA